MKITILICKILSFLLEKLGKGSSFPGGIALKLYPSILSVIKLPETVIAVTGSNGKTSTVELICEVAKSTGKTVISNRQGSNQIEGVATVLLKNCNLNGEVMADIVILESDERYSQYSFAEFSPDAIVVLNLNRDQLTRNGHSEFVFGELKKGLPKDSVLILNADDPLVASFGHGRDNNIYFGIKSEALSEQKDAIHAYFDGAFCPICKQRLSYSYVVHNHLGSYSCISCGFSHPTLDHAVTAIDNGNFVVDDEFRIKPQIISGMFGYNISAAFTVAVEFLDIPPAEAANALGGYLLKGKRIESRFVGGHKCVSLLSKHENSMSYNQSISALLSSEASEISLFLLVDLLSRKYIANDMSWLWDIDFELLKDERIKKIFVSGKFANDVVLRLVIAGIDTDRIFYDTNIDKAFSKLCSEALGDIYVLTCFTDMPKFNNRVKLVSEGKN